MGQGTVCRPQAGSKRSMGGAARRYFRPNLDQLEDRVVLAVPGSFSVPLEVASLSVVESATGPVLHAVYSLAGQQAAEAVPITLTADATQAGQCPILNLELQEISLNVLGLQVDTSDICLDITARQGGGLLGDLLCGLTGDADGLLDLGDILGQLGDRADAFLGRLDDLLDRVLGRQMQVTGLFGQGVGGNADPAAADEGFCNILNLSLGPVDLNLLGLNVSLDNCANGPVTVDITGQEGTLVGGLLCGLADGIDLDGLNLDRLVAQVDRLLDRAFDLIDRIEDTEKIVERVERLIDRLERIVDRVDDLRALARAVDRLEGVLERLGDSDRIGDVLDRLGDLLERARR